MSLVKKLLSYATVSPVGYWLTYDCTKDLIENAPQLREGDISTLSILNTVCLGFGVALSAKHITTYRRLTKAFEQYGYDKRLAKPRMYSWCDRVSVRTAARETGHLEEYKQHCKEEGHKWYHILPKVHRFKEVNH